MRALEQREEVQTAAVGEEEAAVAEEEAVDSALARREVDASALEAG